MTGRPTGDDVETHRVRQTIAAVVCAESIVVAGYGFVLAIDTLVERPTSLVGSAFLALLVVLLGAGVSSVSLGVWRGQRWSRSPALVWQVLQASVAVPALGPRPEVGVPLLVAAVVVAVGVFLPGVIEEPVDGASALDQE